MNIRRIIHNYLFDRRFKASQKHFRKVHLREISQMCQSADIKLCHCPGEEEFIKKWSPLTKNISVEFYRFYSHFVGHDSNILPDDLFHAIIDPLLNDKTSLPVYLNKNMYEKLISPDVFPTCIFRNMDGDYMDRDYKDIQMNEDTLDKMLLKNDRIVNQGRFIIKPATETGRGKGVRLFCLKDGKWFSNDGKEMNLKFLRKYYPSDFIVQECIEPSDFIKQFNPTSYSTCRIFTYRSVKDGSMHSLGGYLRVGDVGSFKDNIGSGGFAIPILENGELANFASNGTRRKYKEVNGINLEEKRLTIPNFDKVLELAFSAGADNMLNRVLSWDILLDQNDVPHIIEFNLRAQTITTIQTTYKTFFGEYTDEIIEYCSSKLHRGEFMTYSTYYKRY